MDMRAEVKLTLFVELEGLRNCPVDIVGNITYIVGNVNIDAAELKILQFFAR
jgi:hypothetical protein